MLSVGITGGIGSGKTTVCRFFEFLNIPVYYADVRAKQLMVEDRELVKGIKDAFGPEAYFDDGQLNRDFLAETAFNDSNQLKVLNSLVHPAVWKDSASWMQQNMDNVYILYEAAILFESGSYKMFDKSIMIYAPEELRISRVMARDGADRKSVEIRMKNQMDDEEKMKLADYIIRNDGEHSLVNQVLDLHKELISPGKG